MTQRSSGTRQGTCRACGQDFTFPNTGPVRPYCPDPECKRRRHARAGWESYQRRIDAAGLEGHTVDVRLPPSFRRPRGPATFSERFRQSDTVALHYEVILARDPCSYCGEYDRGKMNPDHIDPFAQGGGGEWENLTAACRRCNSSKGDASLLLWLLDSPRLADLRALRLQGVLFAEAA